MGAAKDLGILGQSVTGKTDSPVIQDVATFPFQSYFSSTLLEKAILAQPQGEQIVPSTKKTSSVAGYAVGLHPSSQCPIAITYVKGAQSGDSGVIVLKPGMIVRPNGEQWGKDGISKDGRFSGFQWGLPFGWLGGGNATIVVFRTSDAKVDWRDRSELIFHRQRIAIAQPADVPASTALLENWPTAFPWARAVQGANAIPQGGKPILSLKPTRIAMSLRADLANPATLRMFFIGSTEFSQLSTGVEDLTAAPVAYDITFGTWASVAAANYPTQYQFQFLPVEAFRLSSINGAMVLVDVAGVFAGPEPTYVDIIRYGEL